MLIYVNANERTVLNMKHDTCLPLLGANGVSLHW